MKLSWSARAARDLVDIHGFILSSSSSRREADRWIQKLRERAQDALEYPKVGRVVPEYSRENLREVFLKDYRIVYLVTPAAIVIISVFHGRKTFTLG